MHYGALYGNIHLYYISQDAEMHVI